MFCPKCGATLPDYSTQCSVCGAVFEANSQTQNVNQQPYYGNQPTYNQQAMYNQQPNYYQSPATAKKNSNSKVIIPIAIGGGVLVLIVLIVVISLFSGGGGGGGGYHPPEADPFVETTEDETAVVDTEPVEGAVVVVDNSFVSYGYVTYRRVYASDGLNIRTMPTMDSDKVITISNLNMVSVMGYSSSYPSWVYVRYLGKEGWVDSRYLCQVDVANFRITMEEGLNLREGPSTSDTIVYSNVPYNDVVQFIRYNSNATWAYVSYCGQRGWMSANYLQGTNEDATLFAMEPYNPVCTFDEEYTITMSDGLNLRSNPTTDGSRIYIAIPYGESVYFGTYNSDKSWAYVSYYGYTGWVSAKYIKPVKGEATTVKSLATGYYKVTDKEGLNFRSEPSTAGGNSTVYEVIPYSSLVYAVRFNDDYTWAYVEYGGHEGWVSAKNITPTNEKPTEMPPDQRQDNRFGSYEVTMKDGLNLRTEPSVSGGDATVILEIPYGAVVDVIDFNNDCSWAKVLYGGETGWVSAKNIEYVG